jgi:hypothetical protein
MGKDPKRQNEEKRDENLIYFDNLYYERTP